jgi:hypothetical protein
VSAFLWHYRLVTLGNGRCGMVASRNNCLQLPVVPLVVFVVACASSSSMNVNREVSPRSSIPPIRTSLDELAMKALRDYLYTAPDDSVVEFDAKMREWASKVGPAPLCRGGFRREWKTIGESPDADCLSPFEPPETAVRDQRGQNAVWLSAAAGNKSDLWFMTNVNGQWSRPLFTGIFGATDQWITNWSVTRDGRLEIEVPVCQFANWKKIPQLNIETSARGQYKPVEFSCKREVRTVRIADLLVDTDGDYLTDVLENRLGTDIRNSDTDGDGISDARDPSPLCPPGESSVEIEATVWLLQGLDNDVMPKFVDRDLLGCIETPTVGGPLIVLGHSRLIELSESLPAWEACVFTGVGKSRRFKLQPGETSSVVPVITHCLRYSRRVGVLTNVNGVFRGRVGNLGKFYSVPDDQPIGLDESPLNQ